MIKPNKLHKGDTVAIVSLSSGMMGEDMFIHRYKIALDRLQNLYGLHVITMPYALKGIKYLKENPKARAKDLMDAFKNKEVKAIFTAIGGEGGLDILPYIDFDVIKNNPKIFTGFSDTTSNHLMMYQAGLVSYYGLSVMNDLGEYVKINDYLSNFIDDMFFNPKDRLKIKPSNKTSDSRYRVNWNINNINDIRTTYPNKGYELLQGKGKVKGQLLGGCIDLFPKLITTKIWPSLKDWQDKILLIETADLDMSETRLKDILNQLNNLKIFDVIKGVIIGRPSNLNQYETYKDVYKKAIGKHHPDLPIIYNVNVGHNYPIGIFPLGLNYEINCDDISITLLESPTSTD